MRSLIGAIIGVLIVLGTPKVLQAIKDSDIADAKRKMALALALGPCGPNEKYPSMFSDLYQEQMLDLIRAYESPNQGYIYSEWWELIPGRKRFNEMVPAAGKDLIDQCNSYGGKK